MKKLKEEDNLKQISPTGTDDLFDSLKGLTLSDIIKSYLHHYTPGSKAVFSSFLNGETLTASIDDIKLCLESEGLNKLGHSLRITHLETFYPPIMNFCKNIYKEQNILLTCGIYITPNENAQCFLYHCDHQHILAYQLAGEKRWSFPKIAGEYLREYSVKPGLNQLINEGSIQFESSEITLKTGELLFVPYAYSHRAYNDADSPSVHLTFAEDDITKRECLSFVAQEVLGLSNFDGRFFEKINLDDIGQDFPIFDAQKIEEKTFQFFTKTKMLKFKFGSKAV